MDISEEFVISLNVFLRLFSTKIWKVNRKLLTITYHDTRIQNSIGKCRGRPITKGNLIQYGA